MNKKLVGHPVLLSLLGVSAMYWLGASGFWIVLAALFFDVEDEVRVNICQWVVFRIAIRVLTTCLGWLSTFWNWLGNTFIKDDYEALANFKKWDIFAKVSSWVSVAVLVIFILYILSIFKGGKAMKLPLAHDFVVKYLHGNNEEQQY